MKGIVRYFWPDLHPTRGGNCGIRTHILESKSGGIEVLEVFLMYRVDFSTLL